MSNSCECPLVDGCEIYGPVTELNEGSGIGIYISQGTPGIIRNCTIYNTCNGFLGTADFYNNHVHHIKNSIDLDTHENAVYLFGRPGLTLSCYNNRIHHVDAGVTLFLVRWTPDSGDCSFIVYNNIMHDNEPVNIIIDNRNVQSEQESNYYIYNNILTGNNGNILTDGLSVKNMDVRNNIFITTGTYIGVVDFIAGSENVVIDYNIYYDSLGSDIVMGHPDSGRISLEESQALGFNLHSIKTYEPIDFDFIPQSYDDISVDAGVSISPVFAIDFYNNSRPQGDEWDIGPYEYFEGMLLVDSIISFSYEPLKIFPNPTKGIINIVQEDFKSCKLYTASGDLLLSTNKVRIDLGNFISGTYFLIVANHKGNKTVCKVILKK